MRFLAPHGGRSALTIEWAGGRQTVARRIALSEREVRFKGAGATLAGTFIRPETNTPVPAIVLLHGSGPLTRYSFCPYPYFFASLGFAVLINDKRGTGASTGGDMGAADYYPEPYESDAVAALHFLQTQPAIRRDAVGAWGSSEGGMLAMQVAARVPSEAFAIDSSGFMLPLWQQILFSRGADMRANGFPRATPPRRSHYGR